MSVARWQFSAYGGVQIAAGKDHKQAFRAAGTYAASAAALCTAASSDKQKRACGGFASSP